MDVKEPSGAIERVIRYDYRELVPLIRHHFDPSNPAVRRVLDRPRDVHTSIDARFEVRVAAILRKAARSVRPQKGAAVVLDPANGDLLAAVSLPLPPDVGSATQPNPAANPDANPYLDRARFGLYPPGSTFKVVTAMAALRKDPSLIHKTYQCIRLPDGRVGNYVKGSKRPIRDDVQDQSPHGTLDLERGIVVSCNAYFAQLGTYDVGADALLRRRRHSGHFHRRAQHRRAVEEVAAAIVLRTGAGGGVAVPDGARGGNRGRRRRHAARPLDHR